MCFPGEHKQNFREQQEGSQTTNREDYIMKFIESIGSYGETLKERLSWGDELNSSLAQNP